MGVNYFPSLLQAFDLQPMDPNGLVSILFKVLLFVPLLCKLENKANF